MLSRFSTADLWAFKKLAATWGSTTPDFKSITGQLETVSTPPPFEQLVGLVGQNPDIARWSIEVDQREASLELAKADRIPDLTLGAGIKYLNESDRMKPISWHCRFPFPS